MAAIIKKQVRPSFEKDPPAAVDRILAVIGDKLVPADLDKETFVTGLAECLATYYAAIERSSNKATKSRIRRLGSIRAAATRLKRQLLPDDIWDWSEEYWECEYLHTNIDDLISRLDYEIQDLDFILKWGPDWDEAIRLGVDARTLADRWKARSPFEWLAGHYLPKLFTEHFGIKPTFHRRGTDNLPDSPLIRFVEHVLLEFGITKSGRPYSRETIAKAVTDVRSGRARKRRRVL